MSFEEQRLALYILLGVFFTILIIIKNKTFSHVMGWSLLTIKKAQFKNQKQQKKKKLKNMKKN